MTLMSDGHHKRGAPTPGMGSGSRGPLSADHLREVEAARARAKKIRRAAGVAALSGWTLAIFALVSLFGVAFGDWTSVVAAGALGVLAFVELRGGKLVRAFDERGARQLGFNQIALGGLIVAYSAWSLYQAARSSPLTSMGSTGDPAMDANIEQLSKGIAYGLYVILGATGVIVPGLTAWYYFSRQKLIRRFVAETPAWVVDTLRAAG